MFKVHPTVLRAAQLMAFGTLSVLLSSAQDTSQAEPDVSGCTAQACDPLTPACLRARRKKLSDCWKKIRPENKSIELESNINLKYQNGIEVMQPQLYDNGLLRQMLASAQARLALLNVIDQGSVVSRLGSLSGTYSNTASIAASIQGPTPPQISSVQNAGSTAPIVTTTQASPSMTTPALSGSSIPLPVNISTSSADVLSEQMQLSDEIANLSLLLQGPISGSLSTVGGGQIARPKVTIGIPVMIIPKRSYKNAVAVVEIRVERKKQSAADRDAPSVTALLPREKTYNVAAISEKNLTAGGSLTTQAASVSGGFLRSRKSFYVVQDQDTVASTFNYDPDDKNSFAQQKLWVDSGSGSRPKV